MGNTSQKSHIDYSLAVLIPLAVGACAASWDAVLNFAPLPPRFHDLVFALMPPGWFLVKFVTAYAPLALLLVVAPYLAFRTPLVASSTVLSGTVAAGLLLHPRFDTPPAILIAGLFVSALVALGCLLQRLNADRDSARFLRRVLGTVLVGCLGIYVFYWLTHFRLRALFRTGGGLIQLGYLLVGVLLLIPMYRSAGRNVFRLFLSSVLAAVFLMPIWSVSEVRQIPETPPVLHDDLTPRHIVLVVIDTLRADALSVLNPDASPTPAIDALAEESVVFENAISPAPWTFPAMNSLMTGVLPYMDERSLTYETAPLPTLAGFLRTQGYRTRGIVGNHLLFRPLHVTDGLLEIDTFAMSPFGESTGAGFASRWPLTFERGGSTRELTREALRWIKKHRKEPFFLWLHYADPHDPYVPPQKFVGSHVDEPHYWRFGPGPFPAADRTRAKLLYDAEVRYIDSQIGEVIEGLKRFGIYDDSLIFLTSDHGEEFWEHGGELHGHSLHQELLHVPLLIRLPKGAVAARVETHVPTRAILPTALDLVSAHNQRHPNWTPSLKPWLSAAFATPYSQPIVSSGTALGEEFQRSVVLSGFKYIRKIASGREELYDLERDPDEYVSVVTEHPEIVTEARAVLSRYESYAAEMRGHVAAEPDSELAGEMEQRLKSLGYID